jgi:hypothetical protein
MQKMERQTENTELQFMDKKVIRMPAPDTAKGFEYLKEYYGEGSLLKGFVICGVKKDFPIGKEIKAVNGIQLDF